MADDGITADFTNLYEYITSKGIVIPDTSAVKAKVENAFLAKWGAGLNLAPETMAGRLVEAITMLIVNVIGVNALNANSLNIEQAVGGWLDNIGSLFGVQRFLEESDNDFRTRILSSSSRGSGFAASIRNAINQVQGVDYICVLDNGKEDPAVLPNSDIGISVNPHSVFICVRGGEEAEIAKAIVATKSLGCGYTIPELSGEYGEEVINIIGDNTTGSESYVRFYRPIELDYRIAVTVLSDAYTGIDIVSDTKAAIVSYMAEHKGNTLVTSDMIKAAVSSSGLGIVCTSATFSIVTDAGTENQTMAAAENILLKPYNLTDITSDDVTVSV